MYTDMPIVSLFGMKQLCIFGLILLKFNEMLSLPYSGFLKATGSPQNDSSAFFDLKETDLKFLEFFFHCNIPEPTSSFEAVTSGAWPECYSTHSTLQGSRWKQGLARGKESLSASGNAKKQCFSEGNRMCGLLCLSNVP